MSRKRYSQEKIIGMLREAEVSIICLNRNLWLTLIGFL